jgi:hypothetical protein
MDSNLAEWLGLVESRLYMHPEWLADTQKAIMRGLQDRIDHEAKLRSNAEVALVMAYDAGKARLSEVNRQSVEAALMRCAFVAGTPFIAELKARHEGKLEAQA